MPGSAPRRSRSCEARPGRPQSKKPTRPLASRSLCTTTTLICFSYNLGFYTTNHTATAEQTWRPGWDRLDATLSRIHAALNSPAYAGPSGLDVAA